MELLPPAPSTNSTDETMVFSSTIMPQSVQTEAPDGPRDSMFDELQFGHRNEDDDGLPWTWPDPSLAPRGATPPPQPPHNFLDPYG